MGQSCSYAGSGCGPAEYCALPDEATCTTVGVCQARPKICDKDCPGVCGCDGNTYSNDCVARSMGTDVRFDGDCDAADCRTTGCSDGSSCMACRGVGGLVYSCIPDGAAC